jgi:hypothetical protein
MESGLSKSNFKAYHVKSTDRAYTVHAAYAHERNKYPTMVYEVEMHTPPFSTFGTSSPSPAASHGDIRPAVVPQRYHKSWVEKIT